MPAGAIELPATADELVTAHGRSAVVAALLLVKLVHNVVLTMRELDRATGLDEAAAFAFLGLSQAGAEEERAGRCDEPGLPHAAQELAQGTEI